MQTAADNPTYWPIGTLMHRLSPSDGAELLRLGGRRRASLGTVLLRMGDASTHVLLLQRAFIKITVPTSNGREALLAIRVPGDMVGEIAALNDQPRSATATACGDAVYTVIPQTQLRSYLAYHPQAALQLAGMVADRLRWANQRRVDAAAYPVQTRLARTLAELATHYGFRTAQGIEIGVDLTQLELATLIGVSEITVQRALRQLRGQGQIATGYRRILVHDLDSLTRQGNL